MWYYVDSGQQQGPFDETQFNGLITSGTITPATLVWQEGQPNWQPLSALRPAAAGGPDACQVCHQPVGADNLIELGGVRVCAACKPVALQKLREGVGLAGDGPWADGVKVVTRDGCTFPARCLKCNVATTEAPLKRKLYWHPPLYYLLIFLHLIIYVIVAIIVRKRATVFMHLCPEHRQRRKYMIIATWTAIVAAIFLVAAGAVYSTGWLAVAGLVLFVVACGVGLFGARMTSTTRINNDKVVWLKGAGKEFLASLPPWNGA
jgi:hypothetical protein